MDDNYSSFKPNFRVHSHICIGEISTSNCKDSLKTGDPLYSSELMHVLMQRLTSLEETVKSQAEAIENKGKKISLLEQKLQTQRESGRADSSSRKDDLETRCQKLQLQVNEMEDFLGDYGLTWVGKGKSSGRKIHIDFDLVLEKICELNTIAAEELFVQMTARGAKLSRKAPVQLRLYRNGIIVSDGPFRSYQEPSTQQFMQDIMDGYFPSELQDIFPDGVQFQVHDMHRLDFVDRPACDVFPGKGYSVCGEEDEPQNVEDDRGKDQLINKMSKSSSDSQNSNTIICLDTPALQAATKSSSTSSTNDVIMLKVKSEDGNRTYLATMFVSETVGHLRSYLDKHRAGGLRGHEVISTYPQRCFSDDSLTLQSCGLTTNTTLLLGRRKLPAQIN